MTGLLFYYWYQNGSSSDANRSLQWHGNVLQWHGNSLQWYG